MDWLAVRLQECYDQFLVHGVSEETCTDALIQQNVSNEIFGLIHSESMITKGISRYTVLYMLQVSKMIKFKILS